MGKLTYVVKNIKIVYPDDSDEIRIQPGKDMITLLTCHPYRSHGKYRYLVFCERDTSVSAEKKKENGNKETTVKTKDNTIVYESSEPDIKQEDMIKQAAEIFILFCIFVIIFQPVLSFIKKCRNK